MLEYYLNKLDFKQIPSFLTKYLYCPSLLRLKQVGYFCGMDYASKNIYDFKEYISRYDHSLTVALLTYKLTKNKIMTLSGLFHDIATPCFSHVIDYMNEDYLEQESTEEYTAYIMEKDIYLNKCLKEDNINILDIVNFKKYSIVDNDRPKLCADRLDGIILTGSIWTKNITIYDIDKIISDITIYKNEEYEDEIGFKSTDIGRKVLDVSNTIDMYCHSREDNYMMLLLAKITKIAISKKYISYDNLYTYNEKQLLNVLEYQNDVELNKYLDIFKTIKKEEIPSIDTPKIKVRELYPIVDGKRIK